MTVANLNAVGFCAHYSLQGDWAFAYALDLARNRSIRLNVFHFLEDPYDPDDTSARRLSAGDRDRLAVGRERELRLYYDRLAGDYLDVGFRLCENKEWTELHRCLVIREFQVLVLGIPAPRATFGGKPIEEFADSFVCPVVLVGPEAPDRFRLNHPASLMADRLSLPEGLWERIEADGAPAGGFHAGLHR